MILEFNSILNDVASYPTVPAPSPESGVQTIRPTVPCEGSSVYGSVRPDPFKAYVSFILGQGTTAQEVELQAVLAWYDF